eukprot:2426988-Rhodomonas_salina.1
MECQRTFEKRAAGHSHFARQTPTLLHPSKVPVAMQVNLSINMQPIVSCLSNHQTAFDTTRHSTI